MILSQLSATRGASVTSPQLGAGHVLTEVAGHVFVSSLDAKPAGPWILGRDYGAKVDTLAPNATLEVLPDGPKYLVRMVALDGTDLLIGGSYETETGALVTVVLLGRQRLAQRPR